MANTPTENKKSFRWDKAQSTYYWKIILNQNNPNNHVPDFTGYSKVYGQEEAQDKIYLLQSKIEMLRQKDYLNPHRSERVEIYQRVDEIINTKTDPKILVLFPTHYDLPLQNREYMLKNFGYYLNEFYKLFLQNQSTQGLIRSRKKPRSKDDFLNPDLKHFRNLQQLYSYSVRLLDNGHPVGAVNHFITQVKTKNNWE